MPLFRTTPSLSGADLRHRIREQFTRFALSKTEDVMEANEIIRVGPRVTDYGDRRSVLQQMDGLATRKARLQMAYTQLATGAVLLDLLSEEEVSS